MSKHEKRNSKVLDIIKEHIRKNIKEYLTVSIAFLIGIIIGVIFINNSNDELKNQIQEYIGTFSQSLNDGYTIDASKILKTSILNNILLALALWFVGSTVIGMPIVYIIVVYRGFSLGYTISSIMITYPIWKGILFSLSALLLQNIILIPCIFALAVSGIKLYKSIIKDKRKENIKIEILRHTIFSLCIGCMLLIASLVEAYGSSNLLTICIGTIN